MCFDDFKCMAIKQAYTSKLYEKVCYISLHCNCALFEVAIGTSKLNAKAIFSPHTITCVIIVCLRIMVDIKEG